MSKWIHLNFSFNDYLIFTHKLHDDLKQDPPRGPYKELMAYLKKIVDALQGLVFRYFFLFEGDDPGPHLFLALEIKSTDQTEKIKNIVSGVESPSFVASLYIKQNSGDESNGEAVLDFFHATTKYAFYRIGSHYKPGYENNDPAKLVHCFCNQMFFSHEHERLFHSKFL